MKVNPCQPSFFFYDKDTRFLFVFFQSRNRGRKEIPKDFLKEKDLRRRVKKAVLSTVFDRWFPVERKDRDSKFLFSLGSFFKEETKDPRI